MSHTGSPGLLAPIRMHQMDFSCSPQGCRTMPGFSRPTRRVTHGDASYPQFERTTNVVVATSVLLTFISFWRAVASPASELAGHADYCPTPSQSWPDSARSSGIMSTSEPRWKARATSSGQRRAGANLEDGAGQSNVEFPMDHTSGNSGSGDRHAEASKKFVPAPIPQRARKRDCYEKRMGIRRCNAWREVSSARTKVLSASSTS